MGLERLRPVTGDGLFTAFHGNEAWAVAHRLLLPLFGTFRIRDMFDDMRDVADQLCLKWARCPEGTALDLGSDFTRLTLDTVALTCLDFRFNSFYRNDSLHPFVQNVDAVLAEAAKRSTLPDFARFFRFRADQKFKKSTHYLFGVCQDMINERRRRGEDASRKDVLSAMVFGRDPKTGAQLSDEHIIHNMLTFLSAGHETTSAMLTTICYYLSHYPDKLAKAQQEVDDVVGRDALNVNHIQKLPYLEAVMRESLRLVPTAPTFFVTPYDDGVLGGKYQYRKGDVLAPALEVIQRDTNHYGPDSNEFKPERMLREEFAKLSEYAFKPFGNGLRGCIGRTFVWQESLIILAKLLQNFDLKKDDPSYELKLRSDLSVKPDGFYMRVSLRHGLKATDLSATAETYRGTLGSSQEAQVRSFDPQRTMHGAPKGQPIMILHGSNTGTCEALASVLASTCIAKGFAPHVVDTMDSAVGRLSAETPIIMITASYNGSPSSNSVEMVAWLEKMAAQFEPLTDLRYAVFGCGHSDWKDTYQKVPLLVHQLMANSGAKPLVSMGASDEAAGDVFSNFADWCQASLFPALCHEYNVEVVEDKVDVTPCSGLSISVNHPTRVQVTTDMTIPVKHHLEFRFLTDAGAGYEAGDHLLVLPRNDPEFVNILLDRLGMAWDTQITIGSGRALGVQDGTRLSVAELLGAYVELPTTLTAKHIRMLAAASSGEILKSQLDRMTGADNAPCLSLLGLLDLFPTSSLTLPVILQIAAPMRPRTYSISSASATKPGHGTLVVSTVPGGIASNYLANVEKGHVVYAKLNKNPTFRTKQTLDGSTPPLVMIAVGSGLAPFRAVIQELALRVDKGGDVAVERRARHQFPAYLFYGCRGRSIDEMYAEELDAAERKGIVSVRRAYSRECEGDSPKYVTDAVTAERDLLLDLWKTRGAVLRVCAGKKIADEVWKILGPLFQDAGPTAGMPEGEESLNDMTDLQRWRQRLAPNSGSQWEGRYKEEVFS
ncbi:NADPH cytochrome P450 [Diaporthe helianthi]|uniref:NADPH cytochrome P450 n=1 Tax=Diaporthe helianthi TaxID=158607 RepID=A0A2P5IF85_DIAHE|nr:NADPH cytochrome P450 [Diaporthe helianthi]